MLVDGESGAAALGANLGLMLLGGAAGGLIGRTTGVGTGMAWEASLVPSSGCASVVVSSRDPTLLDRAYEALREFDVADVVRLDERARPVRS
jgi:hypothetical protein